MIKLALFPIVLLSALVPLCSGTIWGHLLLVAITCGILFGTVSLGSRCPKSKNALADKS